MAARKGKGRQAVRNGSHGFPGWGYAAIGILIGAILMAVMMRGSLLSGLGKHAGPQANPEATAQRGSEPGVLEPGGSESVPKKRRGLPKKLKPRQSLKLLRQLG